ncbi:unnamed protein product [Brassica oleracea]
MDKNISFTDDLPDVTISALLQKQNNVVQSSEIVIGSGISARNLSEASINVTVLESHDRIGGRSTLITPLVVLLIWELLGYMESPTTPLGSYYTPPPFPACTSYYFNELFFVIKINAYKYNLAFSYLNYRLYDMHGNKIPPQLVTQVGDAFKRILQEVQILEVLSQNGWYYVSCTRCSKKLDRSAASLRCNQCVNHNVTNVVKYHVELLVDDGNNYATFVVFDKEMLMLAKQDQLLFFLMRLIVVSTRNSRQNLEGQI